MLYCKVPMSVFRDDPMNLSYGDVVKVKIQAVNIAGPSDWSIINDVGAEVEDVPAIMVDGVQKDVNTLSNDSINLFWNTPSTPAEKQGTQQIGDYVLVFANDASLNNLLSVPADSRMSEDGVTTFNTYVFENADAGSTYCF